MVTKILHNTSWLFCTIIVLVSWQPTLAQGTDADRDRLQQALNAPAVAENLSIFDGQQFNLNADIYTAHQFMNAYVRGVNDVVSIVNSLSAQARNTDDVQTMVGAVRKKISYSRAMTNSFRRFETEKKKQAPASDNQSNESTTNSSTATAPANASDTEPKLSDAIAEERYDNEDELCERDGWVTVEGPTSFSHTTSFDRMMYANLADFPPEKQKELFARLDITADDFDHYDDTLEFIDELQVSIEDGAGDWPTLPRTQTEADFEYGADLAARLISEQWHSDAEIIDSWFGRGSWKVHKNNLGVILRRTLPGYTMFKLPEDPFCQVRSFTLTEHYTGIGTFQQVKGVRFGYVRFQDCDLR